MKTHFLTLFVVIALLLATLSGAFAQMGISNNGSSPDSSAMLDVKSSTKGFLAPRMTAAERDAITRPANGLLVFCTENNQYYYNKGTPDIKDWVMLNTQWKSGGLNLYYNSGNVGVGTSSPSYLLHIVGGDVKIGNTSGDARKLYFGDGGNVYVGEEVTDNRLGLLGNSLMISIGGSTGSNGQVLTSNGTTCSWVTPSATGAGIADYIARWTAPGTLGTGLIRDNNTSVGINTAPDGNYRLKVDGAGSWAAVYGQYNADHYGYLGNLNYGVYGQYDANRLGYMGNPNYGVYGQYNTNHYGYLGSNDYGVYGRYDGNHYGYFGGASYGAAGFIQSGAGAGVYGYSTSNQAGTPGVYGYNGSSTNGTAYTISNSTNGIVGHTYWGTAYHFGIFGTRDDDSGGPSAGVIGTVSSSNGGQPWGALGYQDASDAEYAGYFSGNAKITGGINDGSNYGISGSVLISNGSNDVYWSAAAGLTGSGTASYLPKFTGATTLANSLVYDNGTGVGIGATSLSGKLHVNSAGASTSVYGQYNSSILGCLGTSSYGAFGQNSATLYGYLGGGSYGTYGQSSSTLYGYLGGTSRGAYGQYNSNILGYLGSSGYGAYGQNSSTLFGYLGSTTYGAYGQSSSTLYGYLGGASRAAYGQYNSNIFGYLGSSGYGAYGQYSTTLYGYLGGTYGAYGQYSTTLYGYLGGTYGAYGQYNSDIFGYLGSSTSGVIGKHNSAGGTAGYFEHTGSPGSYTSQWAIDGYMVNSDVNDGSSYAYNYSDNNSGCIRGYNYNGATYTFGVAGWNYNYDNRCAGVFGGEKAANYWGALGYKTSGNLMYGGYFTSSTTGTGKKLNSTVAEGIGAGAWGDLMGADIHGGIYGMYVEGNNVGIYSKGPIYSSQPEIQLQDVGETKRAALFTNTSTEVTVMTSGQGTLVNGRGSILFDENFKKVISTQTPVIITVTPMGPSNGVYISASDQEGFAITENNDGNSNVLFSYIAIGTRAGYENPQLPHEVIASDFESNIMQGLHNDAETTTNGKGLYYQEGRLMVGQSPDLSGNKVNKEPRPAK